ncbi:putative membrane protein [Campylobacter iguaniorum]|uniref:PDC sensor domain-containing protein n=1 Tax=Campylobacter iguaniorum TaxID=1244531 RepID=UPI0007C8A843|nr:PDC sensor domain-containing protein [Campylobacter iguaniorum]ANE36315.1 putative membrane protein [Campylobacter iguaniorum]
MLIQEIQEFSDIRYKARAYLCYLFNRNIPNKLPGVNTSLIKEGFDKIAHEVEGFEAFYILDKNGIQVENNISLDAKNLIGKDANRSNKAYYYRAVREKRCVLTDPYPSSLTNSLCVTAAMPVYNDNDELLYVVCMDISLESILKLVSPSSVDSLFGKFTKAIYSLFSLALFVVAIVLFIYGVKSFVLKSFHDINISEVFESTIVLTLALAIFDLVKAIFEAEVLGKSHHSNDGVSRTMVRFVGSIIIALAIEALMLVFKFAITNPSEIIYAIYLIGGVALLMISLSVYLWSSKRSKFDRDN